MVKRGYLWNNRSKETSISQFTAVKAKGASLVPFVPALALPSQRNIEPSHKSTVGVDPMDLGISDACHDCPAGLEIWVILWLGLSDRTKVHLQWPCIVIKILNLQSEACESTIPEEANNPQMNMLLHTVYSFKKFNWFVFVIFLWIRCTYGSSQPNLL